MVNVDELQSFPFEVPGSLGGSPNARIKRIRTVPAYESGVDGLVIHRAGLDDVDEGEWTVRHGPTGIGLVYVDTFQQALESASAMEAEFGVDVICSVNTPQEFCNRLQAWCRSYREANS